MWIETIDGNMVNLANATGIQTSNEGDTYKVHAEVIVQHQSRKSMREIYRGDTGGCDAFMADLKDALPMLPIGDHKPKPKTKSTRTNKSTAKAKPSE